MTEDLQSFNNKHKHPKSRKTRGRKVSRKASRKSVRKSRKSRKTTGRKTSRKSARKTRKSRKTRVKRSKSRKSVRKTARKSRKSRKSAAKRSKSRKSRKSIKRRSGRRTSGSKSGKKRKYKLPWDSYEKKYKISTEIVKKVKEYYKNQKKVPAFKNIFPTEDKFMSKIVDTQYKRELNCFHDDFNKCNNDFEFYDVMGFLPDPSEHRNLLNDIIEHNYLGRTWEKVKNEETGMSTLVGSKKGAEDYTLKWTDVLVIITGAQLNRGCGARVGVLHEFEPRLSFKFYQRDNKLKLYHQKFENGKVPIQLTDEQKVHIKNKANAGNCIFELDDNLKIIN